VVILDVIVALAVWPLGIWLVHALPWPDALEDDGGYYPVLGSVKVVLGWLAFAGVPSIAAIALVEWLRSL
jgi:hypothetical protein